MEAVSDVQCDQVEWRKITAEGLNLDYAIILSKVSGDRVLRELEQTLEYFSGDLAKVKWVTVKYERGGLFSFANSIFSAGCSVSGIRYPDNKWLMATMGFLTSSLD